MIVLYGIQLPVYSVQYTGCLASLHYFKNSKTPLYTTLAIFSNDDVVGKGRRESQSTSEIERRKERIVG